MGISDSLKQVREEFLETSGRLSLLNIIDFAESSSGLNMTLYPMQKLILKMFYAIPLSDDLEYNTIHIRDQFNEEILHTFTERECLDWLHQNKMLNLTYEELYEREYPITEINFFIGRRGTKTKMTTIIAAYTLYQLFTIGNPHQFFNNKPVTDEIAITLVSNNKSGAARQYRELTGALANSKFFAPYICGTLDGDFWLKTKAFIELETAGKTVNLGNIRITAKAANFSVRGDANIIVVMDEFCHMLDSEVSDKDKPLDEAIYEAITPSVFEFTGADGVSYGKSFVISSPNGKRGKGYEFYSNSFEDKDTLMVNVPSFYLNVSFAPMELKKMHRKSEASYKQEILAEFNAKVSKWIKNPDKLLCCCNQLRFNKIGESVNPNYRYFMGIDYGFDGDGTAVVVAHREDGMPDYEPKLPHYKNLIAASGTYYVIDYVAYITPSDNGEPVDIEQVCALIKKLFRVYKIAKGYYDQHAKTLVQKFHKKWGIDSKLEVLNATEDMNSEVAKVFKTVVMDGRLLMPRDEETIPDNYDISFVEELFDLKETTRRNNKIKVENVSLHDDRYSAASKAIYLAYKEDYKVVTTSRTELPSVPKILNNGMPSGVAVKEAKNRMAGILQTLPSRNFTKQRDLSKRSL